MDNYLKKVAERAEREEQEIEEKRIKKCLYEIKIIQAIAKI